MRTERAARVERIVRATSFRIAAVQTTLFLVMALVAGGAALLVIRQAVDHEITADVEGELAKLRAAAVGRGPEGLASAITQRLLRPGALEYRLSRPDGARAAGDLPASAPFLDGWSTVPVIETDEEAEGGDRDRETVRGFTAPLPGGDRLTVGEDVAGRQRVERQVLTSLVAIAVLVVATGAAVGVVFTRGSLRRIDVMGDVAAAFSSGDLGARAPRRERRGDDLDRLAGSLNRLLDRMTALMNGLRQVSSDLAHDMRTPLAHHKLEIEQALAGPPSVELYRAALTQASERVDEVLTTFQALLNIAQVESGALARTFAPVSLDALVRDLGEAYGPLMAGDGRGWEVGAESGAEVFGNRRLLAQVLANLIDNALVHARPKGCVSMRARRVGDRAELVVEDDGPGVPAEALTRIFDRLVRLDPSRSGPGAGLGLALATAVMNAHCGSIRAEDAGPGLRVVLELPLATDAQVMTAAQASRA